MAFKSIDGYLLEIVLVRLYLAEVTNSWSDFNSRLLVVINIGIFSNVILFSFNNFWTDIDFVFAWALERFEVSGPNKKRYKAIEDLEDSLNMIYKSFRGANTNKILNNIICDIYNVNVCIKGFFYIRNLFIIQKQITIDFKHH